MAAKYQLITELYRRTGVAVAKNPQAWQGFLSSACRNYKCRFDEQLLIYAQRPDAVAVAKLETWNRQFKRWVNKDSKGIAVFDPKGRRNTLKYYFDVSDTHEGYYGSRPVPIWQMDERYEQAVMERLSDRFGDVESTDLASALMETAKNAVEDNLQDYFSQLKDCTKDSFLEELDDFNIEVIYRRLAANSVAFMLISRCGLDTNEFFDREDFADIVNFNTPATINAIGVATSDIAEMALREISQSIRNVQMAEKDQNRTFEQRTQAQYDKGRQQPERSEYNERNHLQQTGGLSYSRPNITDRARASAWQVRFDAQGLSGEAQASDLSQPADIGQAERASARGRADSTPEVGASDEAALSRAGRNRGTERESSDAVGRTDEQHPQPSGGSDTDRTDLQVSVAKDDEVRVNLPTVDEQIEMIAKAEDENASAFAISKEDIDSVLQKGSGVADGKYRIYRQFQKGEDRQKNIEFLKNEYGTGGGTHIFPDGFSGHSWHDSKGLAIDRNGTYTNHDLVVKWSQVEKRLRELIKDNRYLNPKEKDHYADYLESVSAPQYEIDTQRKIARQRFIDAHRDLPPADKRDTLALRLSDFIRDLDRYEKDLLSVMGRSDLADITAEQMEQHLSAPSTVQQLIDFLAQVQWKTTSVFSRSNGWKFTEELRELHPLRYLYNEGDVVYIGADKYEIATLTEEKVYLQNAEFPILGQEYSRADFEEKLTENPANDHLKVVVTEKQRTETPSEKKQDGIQFSIGFSEHPAFYDRQLNDRYTDLSFALGNKLLGILDEKQHREREGDKNIGWYHKTDFVIKAVIGGEEFNYEGRFDIGDGEGDLIAHIKNFYDYALSPKGEQLYGDDRESLLRGRDEFIPFLEQHTELTQEDEKLLDEIMATESDWYRTAEKVEEKPQAYADKLNGSEAPAIEVEQSTDDLIGREIIIDNRKYLIESIGEISDDVSLRDITFQNNVGFPINRVEKIGYIQKLLEQEKSELPPEEKTEALAVPINDRHNFRINDDAIGVGGAKEKFRNNMAAINLLHELEIENRLATPEEQEVLSRYVGWGGLSMAFDEHNAAWAEEFKELYASLSPEEYRAAMESTLTAFYTPPVVIKAMYDALDRLGFSQGNILEPSCGTGNFFGLLPESMQNSKLHGVEIDSLTGRIAKQLYQKANIAIEGFEKTNLPDDHFDVVLGNVPFGEIRVNDSRYNAQKFLIHDYFFAKALDKVRAGGVVMFITSKGTMDKASPEVRKYIAQRAELLGAIRLPDNTFKANAGTEVTSDILILQKRDRVMDIEPDWIWKDPERRNRLVRYYNDTFNSVRPREYDGSHITFGGISPEITLRPHQVNAIAHILYGGNTLLAHKVGAGKTFEMVAAAQESKRLGLCQKSMFVVPNHLVGQWASEYLRLYPSANILVTTKQDFETGNRKKFCGRIATGDYDAVIIGHSQFEKIPMSIERQREQLEKQLDDIERGIDDVQASKGEQFTVKQLMKTRKAIKTKLEKLNDTKRKDTVIDFEQLGVDRLFIDESHFYKNLYLYTKMRNVGGIAQTEAQKSSDLFMKCRYLDEITGNRGTVFATGTPVSNSMVELYSVQRYLQYDTLAQNGLQHFDSWASTFGETVTALELAPEGTNYRAKTRFAKFYNLPELMQMLREVADIQTADMLKLPVPTVNYHNIKTKPSEIQTEMVAFLAKRAEKVRARLVEPNIDNMLKITNDGRKLALDQRMIDPMLPDDPDSKVNACVDNVYRIWEKHADTKATQLVFCDLSTPKNDGTFNVYDDMREKLIARGIPAEQVRFIHEATTDAQKKELFGKVRSGEVRMLFGSTPKMGAGTNVQDRLIAIHNLDCPWRPSDVGRILRTFKIKKNVEVTDNGKIII